MNREKFCEEYRLSGSKCGAAYRLGISIQEVQSLADEFQMLGENLPELPDVILDDEAIANW